MVKIMNFKSIKSILFLFVFFLSIVVVSAANCWDYDLQTNCESADCSWNEDPWGGWCEEKGCWNFWSENECTSSTSTINRSCSWQSSSSGYCGELDCWSFDGTNETACVNNTYNIECEWIDEYNATTWDFPCMGPPEKQCWNYTTSESCSAVAGCSWGMCSKKDCWDYSDTDEYTCESQVGFNKKSCEWKSYSWGSECVERGCWDYSNVTSCESNGCKWDGSCMELSCGEFTGVNESYCVSNSANLSCEWDSAGKWCMEKGCWNNDEGSCDNGLGCFWDTFEGGWCQEQGCWNWENNQTACEDTGLHPGLECTYDVSGGWCYEDVGSKSCADINVERDCMDTFYCWWDHSQSTCNDPGAGIETEFEEWNPGCYIFDMDQNACGNVTGCYWSGGVCETNMTVLPTNELNCSLIQDSDMCNNIPALSSCCSWQAGECVADRFDQSCREEMQEPPEGAHYCEDYVAYTSKDVCEQIAGSPWFMPCEFDNSTERCEFKGDDVFGDGDKNIMKIDNEINCEAAGGKWILDTYPSTNNASTAVRLSLGRCDFKFDEERNCNKECFACEYKQDKTNWGTVADARKACVDSELGLCRFIEDPDAPNSYGYCEPKEEFKKGLVGGDCSTDCGACTYMGDPAASAGKRPSDYCEGSDAKCKWVADPSHPDDESFGRCASKSEKTCEDRCDKCYDESNCQSTGGKQGDSSAAAVCEWNNGICSYKSGASEMEVCWDGQDNNGDNKVDCADSMCWSDPFCGGEFMFGDFGKDCFMFNEQSSCETEGCAWVNENWGAWCDMPGAVCWKKDGTNQTVCEDGGSCEWHSGFGGFCEQDWDMGGAANSCFSATNQTGCQALSDQNCTWVIDEWCSEKGGFCDPDPSYSGAWYDCAQHDVDGNATCESHAECNWYVDPWCQQQGSDAGFCDHKSFACWQYDDGQNICENSTNSEWCVWMTDPYSPEGGFCEGKMMSGESGSCWDQSNQTSCSEASGCRWMSGFCDPPGFGGEMMPGMPGGEGEGSGGDLGGFGMQCFLHDGDQTSCEDQTGCGWFNEPNPFCDINFESNCPQYSYDQTVCADNAKCKWNPQGNFCDEKPFECFWNTTLWADETLCDAHPLCYWSDEAGDDHCHPIGFSVSTESACDALGDSFRWTTGWCNPALATEFFSGMEMGGPPVPLGSDPDDSVFEDEVDITEFGMKDMGNAFGFGVTVDDPQNSAACNNVKMETGTGTGTNTTKFYWYLDTDGNTTNNCDLRHSSGSGGYEFYIKNEWSYDESTGTTTESPAAYRCLDGEWNLAEVRVSSQKQLMCNQIGGAMVAIDKTELEKFPSLYSTNVDIRVAVASADSDGTASNPTDTASPGWVTPGSQDFEIPELYGYETDWIKKASNEAAGAGFVQYNKEADCWTEEGCEDYSCKGHTFCVENNYGVESAGWTDTRVPKLIGSIKETYPDGAFFAYFTDKPANGTFLLYGDDEICSESSLTDAIYDVGIYSNYSKEYKLWHTAELFNDSGVNSLNAPLSSGTTYYYKIKVCDEGGKCGMSKCSSFRTEESQEDCTFCKFVSRIKAPDGWNVYYDIDQDGNYEHWQGNVLGTKDGMFTNYTLGRKANILINTTDGTAHMEFINATLTKTGMSPKIRDIETSTALKQGTLNTSSGEEIGYVGMIEETRDKIIHNLYPEICRIKIPGTGSCDELWHCDSDGENCVDRTAEATLVSTGSDSCEWQLPYCEFSTWAGGQPATPSSSSSSSGGGGGGGSGGIAGSTSSTSVVEVSHYYTSIAEGESITLPIEKEGIALTKNTFIAGEDLSDMNLVMRKVENSSELPKKEEDAYQYLEITASNVEASSISKATLEFKVDTSWMTGNDYGDVILKRYTDGWDELPTRFIKTEGRYSHYSAETPGFSYFAIVGIKDDLADAEQQDLPQQEQQQDPELEETDTPQQQVTGAAVAPGGGEGVSVTNILIFVVLLGTVVLIIAKKR